MVVYLCLREVQIHLISIKICVVRIAHTLIEPECTVGFDHSIVSHHTHLAGEGREGVIEGNDAGNVWREGVRKKESLL